MFHFFPTCKRHVVCLSYKKSPKAGDMSKFKPLYIFLMLALIYCRVAAQQPFSQLYKNATSGNWAEQMLHNSYASAKQTNIPPVIPSSKNIPVLPYNNSLIARKLNSLSPSAYNSISLPTYSSRSADVHESNIVWSVKRFVVNVYNGIPITNKWYFMMDQYHICKFATGKATKIVFGLCPNAGPPINANYGPLQL